MFVVDVVVVVFVVVAVVLVLVLVLVLVFVAGVIVFILTKPGCRLVCVFVLCVCH